jgi:hypothetical protein
MKEFIVEIAATDYCGFSETYLVQAENATCAEDKAMEEHLEDFIDQMGLVAVDNGDGGYVEMCDSDEWEEDPDSVETTTIAAHVRD